MNMALEQMVNQVSADSKFIKALPDYFKRGKIIMNMKKWGWVFAVPAVILFGVYFGGNFHANRKGAVEPSKAEVAQRSKNSGAFHYKRWSDRRESKILCKDLRRDGVCDERRGDCVCVAE